MTPKRKGAGPTARGEYVFRQRFRVPADWAFRWCISYTPDDLKGRVGNVSRKVRWIGPQTVVLDDAYRGPRGRKIRKVRMVQIYPESRHWVSTHIAGPALHSQFRYTILDRGRNASALLFEGRDLRWSGPKLSAAQNRSFSKQLLREDAGLWKEFAKEIEREYSQR